VYKWRQSPYRVQKVDKIDNDDWQVASRMKARWLTELARWCGVRRRERPTSGDKNVTFGKRLKKKLVDIDLMDS
jgi:hypothetical protein